MREFFNMSRTEFTKGQPNKEACIKTHRLLFLRISGRIPRKCFEIENTIHQSKGLLNTYELANWNPLKQSHGGSFELKFSKSEINIFQIQPQKVFHHQIIAVSLG